MSVGGGGGGGGGQMISDETNCTEMHLSTFCKVCRRVDVGGEVPQAD